MPRKTLDDQRYPFFASRRYSQWPGPTVWGRRPVGRFGDEHPAALRALDGWTARRHCAGEQAGCLDCATQARVSRLRTMYGRRKR